MLTLKIDQRAALFPIEAQAHQRLVEQIARRLTFENPQWDENEKPGFSIGTLPSASAATR